MTEEDAISKGWRRLGNEHVVGQQRFSCPLCCAMVIEIDITKHEEWHQLIFDAIREQVAASSRQHETTYVPTTSYEPSLAEKEELERLKEMDEIVKSLIETTDTQSYIDRYNYDRKYKKYYK